MDDATHSRLSELAGKLGIPHGVLIRGMLDVCEGLPLRALIATVAEYVTAEKAYVWAGERDSISVFANMLAAAIEHGDTRLAAFAKDRLRKIKAIEDEANAVGEVVPAGQSEYEAAGRASAKAIEKLNSDDDE
jgi:hypothetical protein